MTISSTEQKIRKNLRVSRLFNAYLPVSIARPLIEKSVSRAKLPEDMTHEIVFADGVRCKWLIPPDSPQDQVLLYLHGGSFMLGLTSIHLEMVAYLAQKMGTRVLMVDYRLAPDHPFPAALTDCVTVYRWLTKQGFAPSNIVIAGDSAGGNLTITTQMKLRDDGDALPVASACLSPVTNLSTSTDRFKDRYDDLLHPRAAEIANRSYVSDDDARNPLISPVFGDLTGLPPMIIHAGEDEVLCEDAVGITEVAKQSGVDVELEIYPRMWHVWQLHLSLSQATQSLDQIAQFLKSHLKSISAN